jgi:histidine triad (HIT) family protein
MMPDSGVYQDKLCTAFLDIQPINPGHVLIVSNRHAAFLSELPLETEAHRFVWPSA